MPKNKKKKVKKGKVNRVVYWMPRILSILFLLFLTMFSLDVFGNGYTFWETVLGLFMHNIPTIILLIVLIISWKHEWLGAIIFILAGLFYILQITLNTIKENFEWYMLSYSLIIAGPAILIGILFWMNWKQRRKLKK